MAFASLFDEVVEEQSVSDLVQITTKRKTRTPSKKKEVLRGCEYCPLDKVKGIHKVIGDIFGKDILVVAQSPGPEENTKKKELLGPSGKLIWKELLRVGISRDDVDIQNSVRCLPADRVKGSYGERYLKMRSPSKQEISCCSLHTETMMAKSKAKQILVLGQVAAKALLSLRTLPKQKILWSDKYKAKIYLVDHPSFFLRGYGKGVRYENFQRILEQLAADRKKSGKTLSDKFGFVRKQDYRLVTNLREAEEAWSILRPYTEKGIRLSFDIEYKTKLTCVGFSPKPGLSFIFVTHHKDVAEKDGKAVLAVARNILEGAKIHKVAHYGCSDVTKLKELEGIEVKTFDHDSLYSEYLRFSDKKKYGLDELMETRFPKFSGYSLVVVKEMLEGVDVPEVIKNGTLEAQYKYIDDNKLFDISKLSLDTLRLYNGADCDLCKRLEISNKKHVPQALMQLYIDLSFVLMKMEPNGPLFDFEQNEAVLTIHQYKEQKLLAKLRKMLKWKDYNPSSPDQVKKALYEKLELEYPFEGKPNTRKMTLLMLSREHDFPKVQLDYRSAKRVAGTAEGYKYCAEVNGGRLRTTWKGTGTRTGRLSSGGDKGKAKKKNKVNLQNIKKDSQVQNVCIADTRWRKVYKVVGKLLKKYVDRGKAARSIEKWLKRFLPDLKTFLHLDYGQVEVRVAAQMSGDKNLIKDCGESDIHSRVGSTMTGWAIDRIKNDVVTRTLTKNVHFGILFGIGKSNLYKFVVAMSPADMRDRLNEEEVGEAYDKYFQRYPQIEQFREDQRDFAREHEYVETMFGMKQTLNITEDQEGDEDDDVIDDELEGARNAYWGNQCVNGPVQGTAHQLMVCAEVNLHRTPEKYAVIGIPVADIHDALDFRVNVLEIKEAYNKAKYLLEHESLNTVKSDFPDIKWKVPIAVDAEAGLRMGCKVDIDENTTPGMFMIDWFEKCKKQVIALNKELLQVQKG